MIVISPAEKEHLNYVYVRAWNHKNLAPETTIKDMNARARRDFGGPESDEPTIEEKNMQVHRDFSAPEIDEPPLTPAGTPWNPAGSKGVWRSCLNPRSDSFDFNHPPDIEYEISML